MQPRHQILDFWKTVVLWTSITHHNFQQDDADSPTSSQNARGMEIIPEKDTLLVDFRAYLYSKTGIGIGTSASKGNSLPLIRLPEASVPPCQPCLVEDYGDVLQDEESVVMEPQNEQKIFESFGNGDSQSPSVNNSSQSRRLQLMLPYYNHGNTLADRQRLRILMRALVLLRDSLVSWTRCDQGHKHSADGQSAPPCWIGDDPEWDDFEVVRLGAVFENFVPSIVKHVGTPFLDAVAEHKSLVALILPNCQTFSFSYWMRDLDFPTLCLPGGNIDKWDVREVALQIGRMLRLMEQKRKRNETIPSFVIGQKGSEMKEHKQNTHTLYGTTIENIADVIERMGHTSRQVDGAWETGDDMAWDLWLHLGLVRHPAATVNEQDSPSWGRGILVTFSWICLLWGCLFMLVKDREWFSSIYNSSTRRRRNQTNAKAQDGSFSMEQLSADCTDKVEETDSSISISSFLYDYHTWPTHLYNLTQYLKLLWVMMVEEFTEQLNELDRLVDMWKEWAEEESEQLNLLLFSYVDQTHKDELPQQSATAQPQRHMNDTRSVAGVPQNDSQAFHNSSNGARHSNKRRSARKRH